MTRTPQLKARLSVESLEGRQLTTSLAGATLAVRQPAHQPAVIAAPSLDQYAAGQAVSLARNWDWVSGLRFQHNETLVRDRGGRR